MTTAKRIRRAWNRPDNPTWRKVGNIAVMVAGPVGTLAILIFVPAPFKDASIAAWSALVAAVKAGTKLTTAPK